MTKVNLQFLGQSGCRLQIGDSIIYADPYLSNSVQELDSPDLRRLIPIPIRPEEVTDAEWILITHEHMDHCDPHTLPIIAEASAECRFMGPPGVITKLKNWGVPETRCQISSEKWWSIRDGIRVIAVPAAHPNIIRDSEGYLLCVGYVLEVEGKKLYLAGDTSVTDELIETLSALRPISTALLPVNEHNYYRGRRGIIGNMSIRDAFLMADELGINTVIPMHWDMFAINSVSLDEIEAVYQHLIPAFDLLIQTDLIDL